MQKVDMTIGQNLGKYQRNEFMKRYSQACHKDPYLDDSVINSIYVSIFLRDLRTKIFSRYKLSGKDLDSICLIPEDSVVEKELIALFNINQNVNRNDFSEFFMEIIAELAQLLLMNQEIFFEAVDSHLNKNGIDERKLSRIFGKIVLFPKSIIQIVPLGVDNQVRVVVKKIPKEKVWQIGFPKKLGGKKRAKNVIKSLVHSSKNWPNFVEEEVNQWRRTQSVSERPPWESEKFSSLEFNKIQLDLLMSITSEWGWFPEQLVTERILEYYLFYRRINYTRFLINLRSYILETINGLISNYYPEYKLEIKSKYSISKLNLAADRLEKSEIAFEGLSDWLL